MRHAIFKFALLAAALNLPGGGLTAMPARAEVVMNTGLSDLVATLLPSVVNITAISYKPVQIAPGQSAMSLIAQGDERIAFGSGFIVTSDGYAVTNKHVTHGGVSYSVTLSDGRRLPAELVAEAFSFDIAVIKIKSDAPLPPVKLGESESLRQGDSVIAIGNPLGFTSSVTLGIMSAFNRDEGITPYDHYMQTDAAINHGNSGGPLFNTKGEVVGVNAAIYTTGADTGNVGIGLVIPIDDAKFVIGALKDMHDGKTFAPGYLGVGVQALTPDLALAYGVNGADGCVISVVGEGTPAAQAGLQAGDVVLKVSGKVITDDRAFRRDIVETPTGSKVALDVWRDGKPVSVMATVASLPAGRKLPGFMTEEGVAKPNLPPEALANFGLKLAPLTPDLRAKFNIGSDLQGVVVTAVGIGSQAANLGIGAGAVISRVRNANIGSPADLPAQAEMERAAKHSTMPVMLTDGAGTHWVPFSLN